MKQATVIRRLTQKNARSEALSFIDAIAFQRHQAAPPPPPNVLFAAYSGSAIVGTVALDFGGKKKPVLLESVYRFDKSKTPFPFYSEDIAQYGRWIATIPGLSAVLAWTATAYALLVKNKIYGLCEVKKQVADRLTELGVNLYPIVDAVLLLDKIPESGRPYYTTPPTPQLSMMQLLQVERALRNTALLAVNSGAVIFDKSAQVEP